MNPPPSPPHHWSFQKKLLVTTCVFLGIGGIGLASAAYWYQHNFNAARFKVVQLSPAEQQVLDSKVTAIHAGSPAASANDPAKTLILSEREINGFLQEQGFGEIIKVKIGGGSLSAIALIPIDKDVLFVGGHTVRMKIALSPKLENNHHMALYLSDFTIGGISPPNAWLGGMKGINLFEEAKNDSLMKGFSEGIKDLRIQDGEIQISLND